MFEKCFSALRKGIVWLGVAWVVLTLASVAFAAEPVELANTRWRMVRFESSDDTVIRPEDPNDFTLEFGEDGRAYFKLQINRANGPWLSTDDGRLMFGQRIMTMAAFLPSPFLDRWLKDIDTVRSYMVRDGKLFLALRYDSGIYELEPME